MTAQAARRQQLDREAHRVEFHAARLALLRFVARFEHLGTQGLLWPAIEVAVRALDRAEREHAAR